jgi:pimeloyl-ACP methyl ester carboxylesterase
MTSITRRRVRVLTGAGLVGGAATAAAATVALRRWERADQPDDRRFAALPGACEDSVDSTDGARIAFAVAGPKDGASNRTIVLAHGWTNDRRVWEPVACRLVASGHRVVLYDQRGHGASTVGSGGLALEALADDLRAVLERLDTTGAVVAGHSMGGMAAQVFVTLHPEVARHRVGALVLVATACERVGTGRPFPDEWARRVIAHRRVEQAMTARGLSPFLVRRTFGRNVCRAHLDSVCEMFVATPGDVRAQALTAMTALDLSAVLGDVDIPVTVVAGSRDRLLPPPNARRIAQLVPGARLVTYEGTGHMVPLEEPDRLARLLAEIAKTHTQSADAPRRARGRGRPIDTARAPRPRATTSTTGRSA